MTTITIDLTKDPEVAALLADKEPGSKVYGCFSVKSRDEQTATLRIKQMADSCDELKKAADAYEADEDEEDDDEEEMAETEDEGRAPQSRGQRIAANMMGGDGVSRM